MSSSKSFFELNDQLKDLCKIVRDSEMNLKESCEAARKALEAFARFRELKETKTIKFSMLVDGPSEGTVMIQECELGDA